MNQQRSRRFRAAQDRIKATHNNNNNNNSEGEGESESESDNTNKGFDSNCITPGTEFMAKVSDVLLFWIRKKCSEDEAYSKVSVILSGHEVPGEGEHKIMEFI